MNTKEAIEFLTKEIRIDINFREQIYKLEEVISLLQQGEKYRLIVEDIEYELNWHKPKEPLLIAKLEVSKDEEYLNEILDMIENIKQKYFPKPIKKEEVIK